MQLKSILLIKLGAFGDLVLALPWLEAVRKQNPQAKITLLTTPPLKSFAAGCPHLDEIWTIERWPLTKPLRWLAFARELRRRKFERVYDLQRNDRARFLSYLAPQALRRQWFGRKGGLDYSEMEAPPCPQLASFEELDLSWLQGDIARFPLPERYVLLVPGCSPAHEYKRWPAEHYAQVAQALAVQGITSILIGTKDEQKEIELIKQKVPSALDLSGQTSFFEIASLARGAKAALGNDTGPMHLISLAGCPVVSLFSGRGNPQQSRPRGPHVRVLQKEPIETIEPQEVSQIIKSLLDRV